MTIKELKQSIEEISKLLKAVKRYEKRTKIILEIVNNDGSTKHYDIKNILFVVDNGNVVIRSKSHQEMKDDFQKEVEYAGDKLLAETIKSGTKIILPDTIQETTKDEPVSNKNVIKEE